MPRLRNVRTGVVVNVSDEKAVRLGSEFEPADLPVKAPPAPRKSRTASK